MSALKVLTTGASRAVGSPGSLARSNRLAVRALGRRRDDDARARDLGAPTKVQVFSQDGNQRVKTTQRGEEVAAHQRGATGRDEDVALEVLLSVVDLARLHAFRHDAETVAGLTDVQQHHRIVVGDKLRAERGEHR